MGKVVRPAPGRYDGGELLLDTHVWFRFVEGAADQLSAAIVALLKVANRARQLRVSDISVWEIGTKVAKGRLELTLEAPLWLARAERAPGIAFLPVDRATLLLSTRLPGKVHGDPADRILIATALQHRCPLVTADGAIMEYAEGPAPLVVVDARR